MVNKNNILEFILYHIDNDMIDFAFGPDNFDKERNAYILTSLGIVVTKDFLDDIISDPEHYRKFI